jgi:hypothetical protein
LEAIFYGVHHKSEWFERINFRVTQFATYFHDRSKNFTHPECEQHFFPKDSLVTSEIDYATEALKVSNFSALLFICIFLFALSLLAFFAEILFENLSTRNMSVNNFVVSLPKIIHFSYDCKCTNHSNVIKRFNQAQNSILDIYGVAIISSESKSSGDSFEINISLVLKLNAPDQEPVIRDELQALISYLDGI